MDVSWSDWSAPPSVLAAAALAAALFAQAVVRLRRRGRADLAGWDRAALFGLALLAGVLPLVSPLDGIADEDLLSGHMLQHVLIGDVAPALAVVALRGPLVFFFLPAGALRLLAPIRPLRAVLRVLLKPSVSMILWAVVILGWHVPRVYDAAVAHPLLHDLEHVSFVVAGTLVWTQLVDPARHERLTRAERVAYAIGLFVIAMPVADGLLFARATAYPLYADEPHRLFGLSPLADQRLAGVVMTLEQLLTLGTCVALLLRPYLRARVRERRAPQPS